MGTSRSGILALEDGSVFRGKAFGAAKTVVGEAVFNTSMTGYQEILTDPSYYAQIVTMTASQIGNYGITPDDEESEGPKVSAFVIRDLSPISSNWRSTMTLPEYLEKHDIPGLAGIDTRALTKRLRVDGAMKACLSTEDISDEEAVKRAKEWPGLVGVDYVKEVTCKASYHFDPEGKQSAPFNIPGTTLNKHKRPKKVFKVAAFDFGAKRSIFKRLHNHGFDVHVVPATVIDSDLFSSVTPPSVPVPSAAPGIAHPSCALPARV